MKARLTLKLLVSGGGKAAVRCYARYDGTLCFYRYLLTDGRGHPSHWFQVTSEGRKMGRGYPNLWSQSFLGRGWDGCTPVSGLYSFPRESEVVPQSLLLGPFLPEGRMRGDPSQDKYSISASKTKSTRFSFHLNATRIFNHGTNSYFLTSTDFKFFIPMPCCVTEFCWWTVHKIITGVTAEGGSCSRRVLATCRRSGVAHVCICQAQGWTSSWKIWKKIEQFFEDKSPV